MADQTVIKLTGVDNVLKLLQQLPAEVVSKNGGVARVAVRKGALVILKQARVNLKAAIALPGKSGITQTTGFTEKNVVIQRKIPNGVNGERAIITVRSKAHPSGGLFKRKSRRAATSTRRLRKRKSNEITANALAFFMEHGTSKQPATPWLRPAFAAKASEAIETIRRELVQAVDKLATKYLKG